jgi:hypothetical protein
VTGEGAPVSQELPLWKRWPRDCYCIARCRLGIPGQERPFMQAARLSRVLRIRLRIPPWPTWVLHMPKSTPLGEVPVTRTLYDEPIPKGWATNTPISLVVSRSLTALYLLVAVVTVGLHLNEPYDWPSQFGRLIDAYPVR